MFVSKRFAVAASLAAIFAFPSPLLAADAPAKKSGDVYVNSSGMTLYTFDKDAAGSGKSSCNGTCADKSGEGVGGVWHIAKD